MTDLYNILSELKHNLEATEANGLLADALDAMCEKIEAAKEESDAIHKQILTKFGDLTGALEGVSKSIEKQEAIDLKPILNEIKGQSKIVEEILKKQAPAQMDFKPLVSAINEMKMAYEKQLSMIQKIMDKPMPQIEIPQPSPMMDMKEFAAILQANKPKEWEFSVMRNKGNGILEKVVPKSK